MSTEEPERLTSSDFYRQHFTPQPFHSLFEEGAGENLDRLVLVPLLVTRNARSHPSGAAGALDVQNGQISYGVAVKDGRSPNEWSSDIEDLVSLDETPPAVWVSIWTAIDRVCKTLGEGFAAENDYDSIILSRPLTTEEAANLETYKNMWREERTVLQREQVAKGEAALQRREMREVKEFLANHRSTVLRILAEEQELEGAAQKRVLHPEASPHPRCERPNCDEAEFPGSYRCMGCAGARKEDQDKDKDLENDG